MLAPSVALFTRADYREARTKWRSGNPMATSLEKATSSFHFSCFTLAAGRLPPGPSWVSTAEGWPRSHGHRLTLLFMAWARLTAAPERGNIAHLAGLLGAVMPQRPALWQAINVPREKQRESDWLVLRRKVDPLPTPHWGMLWWMLSGGGERHWKREEGTLLCITPVLDIPIVTQDGGPPSLAGPQEVVRQSQSYSPATHRPFAIPLADKWRGDLATCCHLPNSPLTPCIPKASVISKDRPHLHPTPTLGQSFATIEDLIYYKLQQALFTFIECHNYFIGGICCYLYSNTLCKETHHYWA